MELPKRGKSQSFARVTAERFSEVVGGGRLLVGRGGWGTQTITHWVSLWDVIDTLLLLLTGGDLHTVGQ